ncbi:GTPase [Elongatibacter sediminis]|uniref:GTPase n=1 Tax=Elongatibacter sediminis TaxID=3119006 RepID=A0AAW9R955_9GAMM
MPLRLLVSIVILLAALLTLFIFLLATDTALSVWSYLREAPAWLRLAYFGLAIAVPLVTVVLFWSWLRPGRKPDKPDRAAPADYDSLHDELTEAGQAGVDVGPALEEIREQRRRKASGELYIALFGEVSSGKSSLVNALVPEANVETDPRAGTTACIRRHEWTAPSGDRIVVSDLPGFNFEDDTAAMEETRRAHLVIFLCDADLTGSQAEPLRRLAAEGKPVVLALNKSDRYTSEEIDVLTQRLAERSGLPEHDVVAIRTGGREEVVRLLGSGIEQRESRDREPQIEPLLVAVQRRLDENRDLMESLRDTAVLLLASEKLDRARREHRDEQAAEQITRYSRRAVVGALAAVAPGSDLVIQSVLATQLIRELSRIHDVPVKELQIDAFLQLAGSRLKNMTAITLAIAGNAMKAFPGVGTISGGVVHAIAYGMIFDSLGKAAAATLASRGELRPLPAAVAFEEELNANLESGAIRFARLVAQKGRNGKQRDR